MSHRPASRASAIRPASRASVLADAAPLTPHRPAAGSGSVARFGGLSEKRVEKISETIASVRKTTTVRRGFKVPPTGIEERSEEETFQGRRHAAKRPLLAPNGSFLRGDSFNAAPLSSRVPTLSPRKQPLTGLPVVEFPDHDSSDEDQGQAHSRSASQRRQSKTRSKGKTKANEKVDVSTLSRELQEALLVEDLLFVLMGIPGTFIEFDPEYEPEEYSERLQGARFIVDTAVDSSLKEIVERILPLATYYTAILEFTEVQNHIEYGLVNHALSAAIRDTLRDYVTLLAQLEHEFNTSPSFTLQKFWFYVHPTLHTLSLLYLVTSDLSQLNLPGSPSDSDSEEDEGLRAIIASAGGTGGNGTSRGDGIAKGGEVLEYLYIRVQRTSGDPAAKALYGPLLLRASQPYAKILLKWVTTGLLEDPYDEFLIKEAKNITRGSLEMDFTDEYWEKKYVLKGSKSKNGDGGDAVGGAVIPGFLEAWKGKILLAGKYVNVMRECGIDVARLHQDPGYGDNDDMISMNEDSFYKRIQQAYTEANRTLLDLLLTTYDFPGRLVSLRHHFFLSQGDAFTSFLDAADHELSKRVKSINVARLQSQFDLAIRNPASSSGGDPYKEDVKVGMATTSLTDWLLQVVGVTGQIGAAAAGSSRPTTDGVGSEGLEAVGAGLADLASGLAIVEKDDGTKKDGLGGIEALQLDYTVRFPLSLVISRKTILRYQLIFRHLLYLKHLEGLLSTMWLEHAKSKAWSWSPYERLEAWKRRVFVLRCNMLSWVQQMYSFASVEVLEKGWRSLQIKLSKVDTVDGLLRDHVDFLDTCLKECMLTNSKLLRLHRRLGMACAMFSKHLSHFTGSASTFRAALDAVDGDFDALPSKTRDKFDLAEATMAKFEHNFSHHSKVHLDTITYFASSENLACKSPYPIIEKRDPDSICFSARPSSAPVQYSISRVKDIHESTVDPIDCGETLTSSVYS